MSESTNLLSSSDKFQARVSSVLNRNVKEFGKKFLFDGREDTCWNSEQGSPQWIQVTFEESSGVQTVSELQLMFQGGFAGKTCSIEVSKDGGGDSFTKCHDFYPEDSNKLQKFILPEPVSGQAFKIVFSDSTDFFGRITIYQMKLIS